MGESLSSSIWRRMRSFHRKTWIKMTGDLVCRRKAYLGQDAAASRPSGKIGCRILPFFVLESELFSKLKEKDRAEIEEEQALYGDMIWIMNSTRRDVAQRWFLYAQKTFPSCAFVGKMDLDVYVQPAMVWRYLQSHRDGYVYYGDVLPKVCGLPKECNQQKRDSVAQPRPEQSSNAGRIAGLPGSPPRTLRPSRDCWSYASKGFYVLSSNVLRAIADYESDLMKEAPLCGYRFEDLMMGRWVALSSRRLGINYTVLTDRNVMLTLNGEECPTRACKRIREGHYAAYFSTGVVDCFDSEGNLKPK